MTRREKKLQLFLKRLFPSASSEDLISARDRVLNGLRGQLPERVEAFRFWPDDGTKGELRPLDQLVLTAVYLLRGEGDSLRIIDKVQELSPKKANLGTIYVSLDRLEDRELISSELRHDTRWRRIRKITERGERVQIGRAHV